MLLLCAVLMLSSAQMAEAKYAQYLLPNRHLLWVNAETKKPTNATTVLAGYGGTAGQDNNGKGAIHRPNLQPIAGTHVQGWWGFVMRGGDGGDGSSAALGGRGGYVMGCVYVGKGQQLYGAAGQRGTRINSGSAGRYTQTAGFGGGHARWHDEGGTGGGGGCSVLVRASVGNTALENGARVNGGVFQPWPASTTYPTAMSDSRLIAVAGGGGGGADGTGVISNDAPGGRAGNTNVPGVSNGSDGHGPGLLGDTVGGLGGGIAGGMSHPKTVAEQPAAADCAGFLQGAAAREDGGNDGAGGGSGFFGGGSGNEGNMSGDYSGGGGSSYLRRGTGVAAIPSNHFAYGVLNPLYPTANPTGTGGGTNENGHIILIYMGDNPRVPNFGILSNEIIETNATSSNNTGGGSSTNPGTTTNRPVLQPIGGTNRQGWWGFVMRGGDGGNGSAKGGRGGYVMGRVYVSAGEQLYGIAGVRGETIATGGRFSSSAGFGGGAGSCQNETAGGGGGASVLYRISGSPANFIPPNSGTSHGTANGDVRLIAVAGGGGGATSGSAGGNAGSCVTAAGVGSGSAGSGTSSSAGAGGGTTGVSNSKGQGAGFLQGANSNDVGSDIGGGGSGYFGGGAGHEDFWGSIDYGAGGGSSYLQNESGSVEIMPAAHFAYGLLWQHVTDTAAGVGGGNQNNGQIYLVYMGENPSIDQPVFTFHY